MTLSCRRTDYASQSITDVMIGLGETFSFNVTLAAESIEEIIVTAAMVETAQVAVGPSSTFSFDDIQNAPSFDRDIKDVVRLDPRVYIDEADVDNVQCLGSYK